MKKTIALLGISTVLLTLPAASAGSSAWSPSAAGWASGPVRHVGTVPLETGAAVGGAVHEGHLYVSTWRSFSIYDVSVPEAPRHLSTTPLGFQFINEGPATNGETLLLMQDSPTRVLHVWDVSNKRAPRELVAFPITQAPDHVWTCVLDCAYAYGSGGSIVDLTDPAAPVRVGDWRSVAPARVFHGIGEVAPGLVLTGSVPQHYLDARTTPATPTVVATVEPPTTQFNFAVVTPPREAPVRYVDWPREGRSRIALTTIETPFSGSCNERSGSLVTYDTAGYRDTKTFAVADVHRITRNGSPSEGFAPANGVGCSAIGLDAHPQWHRTPLVAVSWAEHGLRLFRVGNKGAITEVGGFLGHGTEAFMPIWASERILYSVDTSRGIDILEVAG